MFERRSYEAFYIAAFPALAEDWLRMALDWAEGQIRKHGGPLLVTAPTRSNFREGPLSNLPTGVHRETSKTFRSGAPVIVACWPDSELLERVDDAHSLKALCVMPWNEDDIAVWRDARRAIDVLGTSERPPEPRIRDRVVEQAMRSVTTSVNLSSGLSHPLDRPKAVWAFKLLRGDHHAWTKREINVWAIANGWRPADARRLAQIADDVQHGKRLQAGKPPWKQDVVQIWREQATQ